ncbi:MAG: D-alanine--D-alanine ligase [Wenzhouxiangellaceae bacterium]|nr:D-alanine--D-alanine ligase [Wenzhouxiangellaceae bacterium]MBS3747496.1 D-alanine--D-alanine ligase [Wenzhouxiangellaceae bacterium]MBS3823625.1 D-alanine--D-alanine ligase [Wenzhouxiangellaceae bacterium]
MSKQKQTSGDRKTIAVIGADDHNLAMIRAIPEADEWRLARVLEWQDVQPDNGRIDFHDLYRQARERIDALDGKPDAIIGYLDFPVTSLVALLSRDYGLPAASPEAVACCEHKYWMRKIEADVFPDNAPRTAAINPFEVEQAQKNAPEFPFWLKPVKSHSSVLGFMIEDEDELDRALHACRQKLHFFGEPFNDFLRCLEKSGGAPEIGGNHAVAEELVSARRQFTLEGYVWQNEVVIYGAIDSIRIGEHKSSFSRYQYPARLPEPVLEKATEMTRKLLAAFEYDGSPFNIEFFWNPDTDALRILEVNPRISKSHSPLFRMVDGVCHQKVAIDLSLGREPEMPHRQGKDNMAAKFMWRSMEADGIVKHIPNEEDVAGLQQLLPDLDLEVLVEKEQQLSSMFYQDSYTYELAVIFLGGDSEEMLEDSYRMCIDCLPIHLKPLPEMA